MTLDQLKAFLSKVKGDANLQEKLNNSRSPDDIVSIAKDHGHEFTVDKLTQLNEDDLESVSGGYNKQGMSISNIQYCVIGGNG